MRERIQLTQEADLQTATIRSRRFSLQAGLSSMAAQKLATATSELTRNVYKYAHCQGWVELTIEKIGLEQWVRVDVIDRGPGIVDLDQAMAEHFSSSGTLGLGLPGVRRLADRFEIQSSSGGGTQVSVWMKCDASV